MKQIATIIALLIFVTSASAEDLYKREVFVSQDGDSLQYRVLYPENIKDGEKYPLVLFLHGAGECGGDNEKQLVHGAEMFLNPVNREKYPAYVIFPQCPEDKYWAFLSRPLSFAPGEMTGEKIVTPLIKSVKELVDSYINLPNIDKNRVYVIGLSMGGMAVFDLVIRFPEIFAAAVPICGAVDPSRLPSAKDVPFRIFHGDSDNVVTVENSRQAYRTLKSLGAEVEYIEFPGCNHGSWNPAFCYPDFMKWIFDRWKK